MAIPGAILRIRSLNDYLRNLYRFLLVETAQGHCRPPRTNRGPGGRPPRAWPGLRVCSKGSPARIQRPDLKSRWCFVSRLMVFRISSHGVSYLVSWCFMSRLMVFHAVSRFQTETLPDRKKFDFFSGAYYKVSGSARDRPSDAFPIASDFFYFRLDYSKDNAVDIDVDRAGRLPAFTTTEAIGQNIDP